MIGDHQFIRCADFALDPSSPSLAGGQPRKRGFRVSIEEERVSIFTNVGALREQLLAALAALDGMTEDHPVIVDVEDAGGVAIHSNGADGSWWCHTIDLSLSWDADDDEE